MTKEGSSACQTGCPNGNLAPITAAYERHMHLVIEVRFNKAGTQLAWLLNKNLR
jgi:hypothetical protein